MPLHTITFASSLLLIALFFALKERETYAGRPTAFTRLLVRHSPAAEVLWDRGRGWVARSYDLLVSHTKTFFKKAFAGATIIFRYAVAMLADKMIKAVRGEKFLEMKGAPSMYLKHLREHKETNGQKPENTAS